MWGQSQGWAGEGEEGSESIRGWRVGVRPGRGDREAGKRGQGGMESGWEGGGGGGGGEVRAWVCQEWNDGRGRDTREEAGGRGNEERSGWGIRSGVCEGRV